MYDPAAADVFATAQAALLVAAHWLRLGLETAGGAMIAIGLVVSLARLLGRAVRGDLANVTPERLVLARCLTLALEYQLATDVLDTALAPGWAAIGELAAIAVIRTLLNRSLTREIAEERDRESVLRKSNTSAAAPG